jgi:hypothetical protein
MEHANFAQLITILNGIKQLQPLNALKMTVITPTPQLEEKL